jgi:hypothetical protein
MFLVFAANRSFSWVAAAGGSIPSGALFGGRDLNNVELYVGRAHHNGALTPGNKKLFYRKYLLNLQFLNEGKVNPRHGVCYVSWGGQEHAKHNYEVLVAPFMKWIDYNPIQFLLEHALPGKIRQIN